MKSFSLTSIGLLLLLAAGAQTLQPGFDRSEYAALMRVSAQFGDSAYGARLAPLPGYRLVRRSPVIGLDNRWDLWSGPGGVGIISIRGTTSNQISWVENFYAAMVPAKGTLQLAHNDSFSFALADDPKAAVHIGWLLGTGFIAGDLMPRLDSAVSAGIRQWLIIGHSQGGAIAFLLNAHLQSLQRSGRLPRDLRFKTYCSAGPKPGNLYFAYAYEAMNGEGWAYNVVNPLDWVPQTPFSVQTVGDFTPLNPFANARGFIRNQKWPQRWALGYAYGKLSKPGEKAARKYRKFLGNYVGKTVRKALPGYVPPAYLSTNEYVRAGVQIVLQPDAGYFSQFPQQPNNFFVNHLHMPYYYLLEHAGSGTSR